MLDFIRGPMGLIALTGTAAIILLVVVLLAMMRAERVDPMQKFTGEVKETAKKRRQDPAALRRKTGREFKALEKFSRFLEPENQNELSAARQRMIQAGYLGKNAVRDFAALQFILAVLGVCVSFLLVYVLFPETFAGPVMMAVGLLAPMLIGYFGPRRWIEKRVEARKDEIIAGFPDALDLMLICVQAGQSLDQSIQRVSRDIRSAYPALAEEFTTVGEQVKAGRERSEVLREMAKRCDVSDISAFVTVLVQAATYGTSMTEALRIFSAEMRDKRMMRAEEKANLLPTKMTLGTMLFTVPPLLIILIGPSVIAVMSDLTSGAITSGM
ncbi:MAG: type II secretion system F family protein [Roseinatronobacter sp.]|nr:type II secretion system F family protein [Roseinatronobacter sp.]